MASRIDNLNTRLDAIAVELAAMSATTAGGLPDANIPAGVSHVAYRLSLLQEQKEIHAMLKELGGLTAAQLGVFEVVTEGYS